MGWKKVVLSLINTPLRSLGARVVPHREYQQMELLRENIDKPSTFELGGRSYRQFAHNYNCGWPFLASATERSVELAIADRWLDAVDPGRLTEVGAVTPYYWPRRVLDIVDPTDTHSQVNRRDSVFDVDLSGRSILSISTFEHIGIGDYGLASDESASGGALAKLYAESPEFLVTFASGYNGWLDDHLLQARNHPADVEIGLLVRNSSGIGWAERPVEQRNLRPYGSAGGNAVFIISRGLSTCVPSA